MKKCGISPPRIYLQDNAENVNKLSLPSICKTEPI